MKGYWVKTPVFIKKLLRSWVWDLGRNEKALYLTFDDGPTPGISPWVLNELSKKNAKATFFCIGKNSAQHPEIMAAISEQGHRIGNHSHNHLNAWKTDKESYLTNVQKAAEALKPFLKNEDKKGLLFRPPYGKMKLGTAKKLRKMGYTLIMWDVLSADFDNRITEEECLSNVINNAGPGSIIVFHDSLKASSRLRYVLPKVLDYFTKKGYTFKAI